MGEFMNLDEAQRKQVAAWVNQGLKLSDIQKKLSSELGVSMTYMELRLLVDDLKVIPKDPEPAKPVDLAAAAATAGTPGAAPAQKGTRPGKQEPPAVPQRKADGVSVSVDHLARPGALVSGRVTFSDGNSADWYLDQFGRLGLMPQQAGYKPTQADLQSFQSALDSELRKMGF